LIEIRPETPDDAAAIRHVNEEAFGQIQEAEIVEELRSRGALTISLVAVQPDEIVGHIAFSPISIESEHSSFKAISLAPMSILPAYQRKVIGSQLVLAGLEECRQIGHELVVVLGHPAYYPRFGFIPASTYGIKSEYDVPDEAFMVLELRQGAFSGRSGIVKYQPEFY
jgi:putative acetyltransferase